MHQNTHTHNGREGYDYHHHHHHRRHWAKLSWAELLKGKRKKQSWFLLFFFLLLLHLLLLPSECKRDVCVFIITWGWRWMAWEGTMMTGSSFIKERETPLSLALFAAAAAAMIRLETFKKINKKKRPRRSLVSSSGGPRLGVVWSALIKNKKRDGKRLSAQQEEEEENHDEIGARMPRKKKLRERELVRLAINIL